MTKVIIKAVYTDAIHCKFAMLMRMHKIISKSYKNSALAVYPTCPGHRLELCFIEQIISKV